MDRTGPRSGTNDDASRRQEVEDRNELEALVHHAEKLGKPELDDVIAEAKAAIEAQDPTLVVRAKEALTTATHRVASEMYQDGQSGSDDVIDADFEEKAS